MHLCVEENCLPHSCHLKEEKAFVTSNPEVWREHWLLYANRLDLYHHEMNHVQLSACKFESRLDQSTIYPSIPPKNKPKSTWIGLDILSIAPCVCRSWRNLAHPSGHPLNPPCYIFLVIFYPVFPNCLSFRLLYSCILKMVLPTHCLLHDGRNQSSFPLI